MPLSMPYIFHYIFVVVVVDFAHYPGKYNVTTVTVKICNSIVCWLPIAPCNIVLICTPMCFQIHHLLKWISPIIFFHKDFNEKFLINLLTNDFWRNLKHCSKELGFFQGYENTSLQASLCICVYKRVSESSACLDPVPNW